MRVSNHDGLAVKHMDYPKSPILNACTVVPLIMYLECLEF